MRYPNGETVRTGDIIWWDEGHYVGRVSTIIDTPEKMAIWGLDELGIFISPGISLPAEDCVNQPCSDFEDEGISLLSKSELEELYEAIEMAKVGFTEEVLKLSEPHISHEPDVQSGKLYWTIAFQAPIDWENLCHPVCIYSCRVLRKSDHGRIEPTGADPAS